MIIKSMSRKAATFGQLIGYMNREAAAERYSLRRHCYGRKERELEAEFKTNAAHMRTRKNGVYMYHEILSITKTAHLSDEDMKLALRKIAEGYVLRRCPHNMVYGVIHDDHAHHLHYHLLISSNEAGQAERTRLSRADFQAIKVEMERRVLVEFPALRQKVAIEKKPYDERLSQKGAELKRRTGKTPVRDKVQDTIREIFADSLTKEELFERLAKSRMNLYIRGKNIGIQDEQTGRKFRLARLGLTERFEELSRRIETVERIERQSAERARQPEKAETKKGATMNPLKRLQETAANVLEGGKRTFDGMVDRFTPTDEAAKAAREAREAREAAKAQDAEASTSKRPQEAPQAEEDPIEAIIRSRMGEMEALREQVKQTDQSQAKRKR